MSFDIPVLFCVFNRPRLTERVLQRIARIRPRYLLVSGDGPRPGFPGEAERVRQTRALLDRIHWPCERLTLYPETNRGCRQQMADAITWAFEQFERVIIVEDDCLPDTSFFAYCQDLLDRYATDPRVMMISGDNFQPVRHAPDSYYFSSYAHIWGWATWRRAWQHFDLSMASWSEGGRKTQVLNRFCSGPAEIAWWTDMFNRQRDGKIDTWDYAWAWTCWKQNGLAILPERNLVSNIGFGDSATHTVDPASCLANRPAERLDQLVHPTVVARDTEADNWTWNHIFAPVVAQPQAGKPKRAGWMTGRSRRRAA